MLELLLLLGVLAYLIAKWSVHDAGAAHVPVPERGPDPPAPFGVVQRLTIADTQRPQLASAAFVRAFGLDPRDVRDIRMYARGGPLETFPAALAALLFELHREGCVVGAESAALLFRGRPLQDGDAQYFALTAPQPMPRVVAFLDKQL